MSTTENTAKAPASPVTRTRGNDETNLTGVIAELQRCWVHENLDVRVKKNPVPDSFGDAIEMIDGDRGVNSPAIEGATDVFPRVVIPKLPLDKLPEYLSFLFRATLAATRVEQPGIYNAISQPIMFYLVGAIVATRVGVWSSTRIGPVSTFLETNEALYYDTKRDKVFIRAVGYVPSANSWRLAYKSAPTASGSLLESMILWCKVAPLVLCTACTGLYALSGTYSTPFVNDAIARYMKSSASPETHRLMRTNRSVVWDTVRCAAAEGMPERVVHAWTDDPLLAVTAERRIMTSNTALRASRERTERVRNKLEIGDTVLNLAAADNGSVEHQQALWEAVALAKQGFDGDDDETGSIATALLEDSRDGKLGLASLETIEEAPDRAEDAESSTGSMGIPEVSLADRAVLAEVMAGAHGKSKQPASVMRDLQSNLPVEW